MKRYKHLSKWWAGLVPRERRLAMTAAMVLTLALTWIWLISPAWRTLRDAPQQKDRLTSQWQQMRAMSVEAQALISQKFTPINRAASERALQSATQTHLDSTAQVRFLEDRVIVQMQSAHGDDLAQWLEEARVNARLTPMEAQLTRTSLDNSRESLWNGTLVLNGAGGGRP